MKRLTGVRLAPFRDDRQIPGKLSLCIIGKRVEIL